MPITESMTLLGVDPGLNTTGFGVIAVRRGEVPHLLEAGAIRPQSHMDLPIRLLQLAEALEDVLAAHRPQVLVLEDVYGHPRFPKSALILAHARGAICTSAARAGVRVVTLPSSEVKKSLTGYGRATKDQVQQMVAATLRLALPIHPVDITDALALALTFAMNELKM